MRYRLGRFTPQPGSGFYDPLHRDPQWFPALTRALEEMLQLPLSRKAPPGATMGARTAGGTSEPSGPASRGLMSALSRLRGRKPEPGPDLLTELALSDPDRGWVEAVHRRLADLSRRSEIRLLACDHEPGPSGFLAIAATSPALSAEVRTRDTVWGGFAALRDAGGPVRIWARVFRLVCQNGSLVSVREDFIEAADVEAQIERCFDRARFMSAVTALRAAATRHLPDPRPMLDEGGYMLHRGPIEARWREESDPTVYGLMNAMTSVARDLPDIRERLKLEEEAGSLARLRPRPRSRRPDPVSALVPV